MLLELNNLTPTEFEDLMHDLFQGHGWNITFHAGVGPDGGRDLEITRQANTISDLVGQRYIVQCKRYSSTVGINQVQDVSDTLARYGADGFILAVTLTVSEPLATKLRQLSERGQECLSLRSFEIHDMVTDDEKTFHKYFPDEFTEYSRIRAMVTSDSVSRVVSDVFSGALADKEVIQVRNSLATHNIETTEQLTELLKDRECVEQIEVGYQDTLNRKPSTYEVVYNLVHLCGYKTDQRPKLLQAYLSNTPEYLSRLKFILSFGDLPVGRITLDAVHQAAFGFRTYHSSHREGVLEIQPAAQLGASRSLKISSSTEAEFRVVGLQQRYFYYSQIYVMDYNLEGFFQVFILVRAQSGKQYFLQYIDGIGKSRIVQDTDIDYIQNFGRGVNNGPALRKEMYFAEDLKQSTGEEVAEFLGLYIGVKGSLEIFRMLLS